MTDALTILPLVRGTASLPPVVILAGPAAQVAWDEFFAGQCRNKHTKAAYLRAVKRFLAWIEPTGCPLERITPGMVGNYLDSLPFAAPTKKLELAALRRFFDVLTVRHITVINPAASVRGDRHQVLEGSTPAITPTQARALLNSIDTTSVVGLRDRAILGCLAFTAARAGAVASLKRGSFTYDGTQFRLRFQEKNAKRRDVPVRYDLERFLLEYLEAAKLNDAPVQTPLFRSAVGRSNRLTAENVTALDIWRLVKRRLHAAGLPEHLSPHSFRVAVATDLLSQSVPLEDVQFLLGHSDPRTTRLYDRRQREVTRNLVERISL